MVLDRGQALMFQAANGESDLLTSGRSQAAPFLWRNTMNAKFDLGSTYITANARNVLNPANVVVALRRHASGDWGDVCAQDAEENELSLTAGFRILSVYHDSNQVKFWIITEADRSLTTVLLPDDY